jgi:hypothetical protein
MSQNALSIMELRSAAAAIEGSAYENAPINENRSKRRICYCKNPVQRLRIYASLRAQMHRHWTG